MPAPTCLSQCSNDSFQQKPKQTVQHEPLLRLPKWLDSAYGCFLHLHPLFLPHCFFYIFISSKNGLESTELLGALWCPSPKHVQPPLVISLAECGAFWQSELHQLLNASSHPESMVYIPAHSLCCVFCSSLMYSRYPPIWQYHKKHAHCPQEILWSTLLISLLSSLPGSHQSNYFLHHSLKSREKGFLLTYSSKVQFIMVGKSGQQEPEAPGPITFRVSQES